MADRLQAEVIESGKEVGGILLADRERSSEPTHVTIVGSKTDPAAAELFAAACEVVRIDHLADFPQGPYRTALRFVRQSSWFDSPRCRWHSHSWAALAHTRAARGTSSR